MYASDLSCCSGSRLLEDSSSYSTRNHEPPHGLHPPKLKEAVDVVVLLLRAVVVGAAALRVLGVNVLGALDGLHVESSGDLKVRVAHLAGATRPRVHVPVGVDVAGEVDGVLLEGRGQSVQGEAAGVDDETVGRLAEHAAGPSLQVVVGPVETHALGEPGRGAGLGNRGKERLRDLADLHPAQTLVELAELVEPLLLRVDLDVGGGVLEQKSRALLGAVDELLEGGLNRDAGAAHPPAEDGVPDGAHGAVLLPLGVDARRTVVEVRVDVALVRLHAQQRAAPLTGGPVVVAVPLALVVLHRRVENVAHLVLAVVDEGVPVLGAGVRAGHNVARVLGAVGDRVTRVPPSAQVRGGDRRQGLVRAGTLERTALGLAGGDGGLREGDAPLLGAGGGDGLEEVGATGELDDLAHDRALADGHAVGLVPNRLVAAEVDVDTRTVGARKVELQHVLRPRRLRDGLGSGRPASPPLATARRGVIVAAPARLQPARAPAAPSPPPRWRRRRLLPASAAASNEVHLAEGVPRLGQEHGHRHQYTRDGEHRKQGLQRHELAVGPRGRDDGHGFPPAELVGLVGDVRGDVEGEADGPSQHAVQLLEGLEGRRRHPLYDVPVLQPLARPRRAHQAVNGLEAARRLVGEVQRLPAVDVVVSHAVPLDHQRLREEPVPEDGGPVEGVVEDGVVDVQLLGLLEPHEVAGAVLLSDRADPPVVPEGRPVGHDEGALGLEAPPPLQQREEADVHEAQQQQDDSVEPGGVHRVEGPVVSEALESGGCLRLLPAPHEDILHGVHGRQPSSAPTVARGRRHVAEARACRADALALGSYPGPVRVTDTALPLPLRRHGGIAMWRERQSGFPAVLEC
ncbi:ATP-dependent protease, putative [Babesia caballi]|uniref:ATP-dependent protease, putative n=1 Tax=Babesia caballi TaxID=5871 RepID=A0AAV4LRI7_BABCB|nr:ATP-dependent protease, putative [Babesia caballi]